MHHLYICQMSMFDWFICLFHCFRFVFGSVAVIIISSVAVVRLPIKLSIVHFGFSFVNVDLLCPLIVIVLSGGRRIDEPSGQPMAINIYLYVSVYIL